MVNNNPVFILLFLLVQGLGFSILWRRLERRRRLRPLVVVLFVVGNLPWLVVVYYFAQAELIGYGLTRWMIRPFLTWQAGVFLWLVTASLLSLDILLFFRLPRLLLRRYRPRPRAAPAEPSDPARRQFIFDTARISALVGAGGAAGWGLIGAGGPPRIVERDLRWGILPAQLEGLRIAHLTDLHIGIWTSSEEIGRAFEIARGLTPDLVVLTGDLIDHLPDFCAVLTGHLPMLAKVPLGVFGVTGNHDVYTGADAVSGRLMAAGVRMLRDDHESLASQGLPLTIAGIDDPGRRWLGAGPAPMIAAALAGAPEEHFRILLAHRPTAFEAARAAGLPLTLSGHTHGGQYGIPGGPNLAALAFEHSYGPYAAGDSQIHVSAGIGSVGLPFRLGMTPEVVSLRLTRGP